MPEIAQRSPAFPFFENKTQLGLHCLVCSDSWQEERVISNQLLVLLHTKYVPQRMYSAISWDTRPGRRKWHNWMGNLPFQQQYSHHESSVATKQDHAFALARLYCLTQLTRKPEKASSLAPFVLDQQSHDFSWNQAINVHLILNGTREAVRC